MILVIFFLTTNLNNVFKQIPEKKIIFMLACKSFFFYFLLQKIFMDFEAIYFISVYNFSYFFFHYFFQHTFSNCYQKKNFEKSLKLTKLHI